MTITSRPRARRSRPRPVAVLAGLALVAVTAVVLVPDLLGLDDRLPFVALVAFRPLLTVVTIAAAAAMLVLIVYRRRRGWPTPVAMLVIALIAAAMLAPRTVGDADEPVPPGARQLSLLSFNVFEGGADVGAFAALLRDRRPDLVVLPESAERYRALITAAVPELGYRSWVAAAPGARDVEGVTVLASPALGPLQVRVVGIGVDPWLELTGGTLGAVRLVGVHTAAPVPGKIGSWPRELAAMEQWCARDRGAAVLAGDFNATLDHSAFRSGTEGCRDTGDATGVGLTGTWPTAWPRVAGAQIDHVLTTGGPTTRGLEVLDLPGSDHRALLTTVVLPRP